MMASLFFLLTAMTMPAQPSPSPAPAAPSPRSNRASIGHPRQQATGPKQADPTAHHHQAFRPQTPNSDHHQTIRPQEKPIVLILSTPKTHLDLNETLRFCGLLLAPYGFAVQLGPDLKAEDFPGQIDEARKAAETDSAIAVAWYRDVPSPSGPNRLFLHVLDLVTDKTLVRTVRIEGDTASALHRAAALKIWSLLRASLLEVRFLHHKAPRAVTQLIHDRGTRPPTRRQPIKPKSHRTESGQTTQKSVHRKVGKTSWATLTVGYSLGIFASGKVLHHAITLAATLAAKRWRGLRLDVGIDLDLPFVPDQDLAGASLGITLLPVTATCGLTWQQGRFVTGGGITAGILVVALDASLPDGSRFQVNKTDPTVGFDLRIGYRVARAAAIVAMVRGDVLVLGQIFEYNGAVLRMDRMRLAFGLGFEIGLQ
ncbi:MAG: hypothetical protein J7M25_15395 [Deltaproteobacteria bacterium]|nr:hypothetical protein [Deltaproteobacteria bacterium]